MSNKDKLIEQAALLMGEKGYDPVTMDMVIERTGIAKSNAYYHYPSKEQLGYDALQFWRDHFSTMASLTLGIASAGADERMRQYQKRLLQFQNESPYFGDCITTIATQINTEQSRDLYLEYRQKHIAILADVIRAGQNAGVYSALLRYGPAAEYVYLTILGALSETRLTKSTVPLVQAFGRVNAFLTH